MLPHKLSRALTALAVTAAVACVSDTPEAPFVSTHPVDAPAGERSGEPFLSSDGGRVYLSWLEEAGEGTHELRFASWEEDAWGATGTIARSDRFFVNWADFPSVTATEDGMLWAHWLERGAMGGYDYGVRVVRSPDGGRTWSEPWTPHEDDTATEHGFVAVMPIQSGIGLTWLDGREYAVGPDGSAATNEMTLRFRTLGADGTPGPEVLVDGRVCDCCQTDAAMTSTGPVVVYRDRTEAEIRDIYVTRLVGDTWTEGAPVHADGWEIGGCPVNGPAVTALGEEVAVAWFTAPNDVARVKLAFSGDGGATFGSPVVIDDGNPIGRVDVLPLGAGRVLVSWLEQTGPETAAVRLREVRVDGSASASGTVAESSAARASGFPRMARLPDGGVLVAWTDVAGDLTQVRLARLDLTEQAR